MAKVAPEGLITALDIGSSKVSAMIAQKGDGGELIVLGTGQRESRGVKRGYVADMAATEVAVREAVEQAERIAGLNIENVWVGFSAGGLVSDVAEVEFELGGHRVVRATTHPVGAEETTHVLTLPDGTTARPQARSALGVLRSLAGLLETGLLALGDAGVTRVEAGVLQRRAVELGVDPVERAGDAEADRAGLARGATTVDAHEDVVGAVELEDLERLVDDLLVHLVGEVPLEGAAVDLPLARTGDDADAGDGLLAAAGRGAGRGSGRATNLAVLADGAGRLARVFGQLRLVRLEDVELNVLVCHGSPKNSAARAITARPG